MNFNVKQRLLLVALLPASLLAFAIAAYFTYAGVTALDKELRQRGLALVSYLAPMSEYGVLSGQVDLLQGQVQAAARQPAVKAVMLVGRDGRVLAVAGRVSLAAEDMYRPLQEPSLVNQGATWIAYGAPILRSVAEVDDLFDQDRRAPSVPAMPSIGQVFVEIDTTEVYDRQRSLLINGLLIVLVGLGLASAYAISIASRAVQPLVRLVDAVRQMSAGNYQARVPPVSAGEFGILERGFNDMAEHIDGAHRELQSRIEAATAHLAFQARHDALTNLINRREFEVRLEHAIAAVQAGGTEVNLLFLDLDRFKQINDSRGHIAGDDLLRQVARLFEGRLRERDTLARIGGDEFAIILPHCSQENAYRIAQDICQRTADYRFIWQEQVFTVGVSIGLVTITPAMQTVTDVLAAGDAACYEAKEAGRNCVQVHTGTGESHAAGERWRERIETALREHRVRCQAMPLRPMLLRDGGGAIHSEMAEVAAVLDERRATPMAAPVLREVAERAGLAFQLDCETVDLALEALSRARAQSPTCSPMLLVPLSVATIKWPDAPQSLVSLIQRGYGNGKGICVMLAEDAVIRHLSEAAALCKALRAVGCHVALIDFGGWLASFNHLDVIRPDLVRINRALTRDLPSNRSAAALVRAIQDISTDRGISTIAEGVDDAPTLEALQDLGIHYVQGRFIAPVEPLSVWVEGGVLRAA